ncbi:DUF1016 N-terminal domain-containing protein [Parapedobacter soli]|uniref:DUF1016 N-terminal domain-containing protein n=1 Tax=Parapedobacter soli TaxID=416955 RepID=UPI0021C97C70|nr:DUF1016 N-terminal domain-containing protein [Parapedobacter soli]
MKSNEVELTTQASTILDRVKALVEAARTRVALYVNTETSVRYWSIGEYLSRELVGEGRTEYGRQILATLSQGLTMAYGKGPRILILR